MTENNAANKPPKRWLALLLNFFVNPIGFYYLKDSRRFLVFTIITLFGMPAFTFVYWLLSKVISGSLHFVIIILISVLYLFFILIETNKSYVSYGKPDVFIFIKPHSYWFVPVYLILTFIIIGFTDEWRFMRTHNIPSFSMEPNIQHGDYILVDNFISTGKLKRGDIITFTLDKPEYLQGKKLIKRIIGLPGDTVKIKQKSISVKNKNLTIDIITINGREVPYRFSDIQADKLQIGYLPPAHDYIVIAEKMDNIEYPIIYNSSDYLYEGDVNIKLQAGQYFVLGDNRNNSDDSRTWGPVHANNINGKYLYTYISIFWNYANCKSVTFNPSNEWYNWLKSGCPSPELRQPKGNAKKTLHGEGAL